MTDNETDEQTVGDPLRAAADCLNDARTDFNQFDPDPSEVNPHIIAMAGRTEDSVADLEEMLRTLAIVAETLDVDAEPPEEMDLEDDA